MGFTTYYISSSGQPRNGEVTHEAIDDAMGTWVSNCGALLANSGGKSVLIDNGDGEDLIWLEHAEGAYVTGEWAQRSLDGCDSEDIDTPQKVAKRLMPIAR